jgi:steroid 5-alpha reductase family enzyme
MADPMIAIQLLGATLGLTLLSFMFLWLLSLWKRNASIVDVYWGPGFVLIASLSVFVGDGAPARQMLLLVLTAAWGLRLGAHLLLRNWGKPEDRRYAVMRRHYGDRFGLVSLGTVFLLQAVLMWTVALPVQWGMLAPGPSGLTLLDLAGGCVWLVGFCFETVGDWQLVRFKSDPANEGRVMDRGLWRYTRHPNYFGDAVVWWGLFLIAASTPGVLWTIIGPIVMTTLLLRVSGVSLLERTIVHRRPEYRGYIERTSAFVPWPPSRR